MKPYLYNSEHGIRPPLPTRDQILKVKYAFQGLTVNTSYGPLPWWETLAWLSKKGDRNNAYIAKHNNRDTHAILDISGNYLEPGQIYSNLNIGRDYTNDLGSFKKLALEVLNNGFYLDIRLAGDGQSVRNSQGQYIYNDPAGMTYGFNWLMDNFEQISSYFKDIYKYCIFTPGYDGIFYGWSPEQVVQFGNLFRNIFPDGNLGIEFNTGHIPLGEGNDYLPGGRMSNYDILFGEFDGWINNFNLTDPDGHGGYRGDMIWQIVGRLALPYIWPADEPANADKNPPPFLLANPNPRGKFYFNIMEFDTYRWVRNQVTREQILQEAAYFNSLNGQLGICI